MKLRKLKTCKNKGCTNTFSPHKSTEKYCSYDCLLDNEKPPYNKPKKNKKKVTEIKSNFSKENQLKRFDKPKTKSNQIRKNSTKRRNENMRYSKKRKTFLNLPENKICPVTSYMIKNHIKMNISSQELIEWSRHINTCQVHHKAGRIGHLLLYTPFWLAVSDKGHRFIHKYPDFSYKMNWLLPSSKNYKK